MRERAEASRAVACHLGSVQLEWTETFESDCGIFGGGQKGDWNVEFLRD